MIRKRRVFSEEFKQQVVRRVRERSAVGVTMTQIGREVGVRADLLRRWVRLAKALEGPTAGGGGSGEEIVTLAELKRLRRENDTLRQERDFAKKAAAFFAKELR